MNYITLEEFKKTDEYNDFISKNPSIGHLKIQVNAGKESFPIKDTNITITKDIGNKTVIFFDGLTDESGIIDNVDLPAPAGDYNEETYEIPEYTTYMVSALNPKYDSLKKYDVGIFNNVKAIQHIKMVPIGDHNG